MGDRSYVMDVHLKRQYIGTYIGQLKGGYALRGAHHQRTAPEDSIYLPKTSLLLRQRSFYVCEEKSYTQRTISTIYKSRPTTRAAFP